MIARLLIVAALVAAVVSFILVVFTDPAEIRTAVAFGAAGLGAISVAALL
jgi:hypothetical protein